MKNKKPLFIALVGLDVALTIFLFVISIIMLATLAKVQSQQEIAALPDGLIKYLAQHPGFYGGVFVIPLFVLLLGNIIGLVLYVRRTTKREPVKVNDLSDEQKEALRRELLKDLQKDLAPAPEAKAEEKPTEEEKVEEKKE